MLLPVLLAAALHAPADSVAGRWQITGDVVGNPVNTVCTIRRDADKLSGSCTGADGKTYDLTGGVKGDTVTFQHAGEYQGQPLTLTYTGTLGSPTSLKGTIDVSPFNVSGQFTAAPAKDGAKD